MLFQQPWSTFRFSAMTLRKGAPKCNSFRETRVALHILGPPEAFSTNANMLFSGPGDNSGVSKWNPQNGKFYLDFRARSKGDLKHRYLRLGEFTVGWAERGPPVSVPLFQTNSWVCLCCEVLVWVGVLVCCIVCWFGWGPKSFEEPLATFWVWGDLLNHLRIRQLFKRSDFPNLPESSDAKDEKG